MQLILLILINVIMGTIFYLILRLKLEKYASDYREKRLKREMDEIICEFNATAERNISILENRIEIFKKLLEKTGAISNIDFSVDDDKDVKVKHTGDVFPDAEPEKTNLQDKALSVSIGSFRSNGSGDDRLIFKYSRQIKERFESFKTIINKQHIFTKKKTDNTDEGILKDNDAPGSFALASGETRKEIIDISIDDMPSFNAEEDNGKSAGIPAGGYDDFEGTSGELNETELGKMFEQSSDKYSLISDLLNKGYETEIISRCSGIPIGEIKLVLDLSSSL